MNLRPPAMANRDPRDPAQAPRVRACRLPFWDSRRYDLQGLRLLLWVHPLPDKSVKVLLFPLPAPSPVLPAQWLFAARKLPAATAPKRIRRRPLTTPQR